MFFRKVLGGDPFVGALRRARCPSGQRYAGRRQFFVIYAVRRACGEVQVGVPQILGDFPNGNGIFEELFES
jgi:hypothetical protein